ncbi:MAG: hypothetical protein QOH66_1561 [Actinomycetota bacterium]|jgi:hypothetical protein|nr:hypothetical protein [Actinomycetota bacterium]
MAIDNLCFSDFDPVTGAPTLDGFTGIEDAGVITFESEPGYVLGERLDLGAAGAGTGSGFPPAIFQAVRNGNFLNLAFFCRFDFSFDDEDVIILAVKPSAASPQEEARRVDIFPVYGGIGTDDPKCPGGHCPDDPAPGQPAGVDYHIRTNHPPQFAKHFRGNPAGSPSPWTSYAGPTGFTAMARSWMPPVPNLPNVCKEVAWSVEVQLPRTKAAGGPDWIDLNDSFAIYFNIMRVTACTHADCSPPCGLPTAVVQFRFPPASPVLTGVIGAVTDIPTSSYGTGFIPALQPPPGSNCGLGVKFVNGELSVGARDKNAGPWTAPGSTIVGPSGTIDNLLVAQVQNTNADSSGDAPGVTAEFRFANWGMGPASFPAWAPAKGSVPEPTNPTTITHGSAVELTSDWLHKNVPPEYAAHPHQCVWVQLDTHQTGPPVDVNFIQSSVRRNMDFASLSDIEQPAEISGVGYRAPARGSHHDFVLLTNVRQFVTPVIIIEARGAQPLRDSTTPPRDSTTLLWIVHGYRRTGETVQINEKKFEILDDAPGAFGLNAVHEGTTDVFTQELTGGGIRHRGGGAYDLQVPHGRAVTITTRVTAGPPKPWWWYWLTELIQVLKKLLEEHPPEPPFEPLAALVVGVIAWLEGILAGE